MIHLFINFNLKFITVPTIINYSFSFILVNCFSLHFIHFHQILNLIITFIRAFAFSLLRINCLLYHGLQHLIFACLSSILLHCHHPNHFFITHSFIFSTVLFFLTSTHVHYQPTIPHLPFDFLCQHLPLHSLQLLQLHFSYLVTSLYHQLNPFLHPFLEAFHHLDSYLPTPITLNAFLHQNHFPFQCHFLPYYLHYYFNFFIHPYDP